MGKIYDKIKKYYDSAVKKTDKQGWGEVSEDEKKSFYEAIPAVEVYLAYNDLTLDRLYYDESYKFYYTPIMDNKKNVGYVSILPNRLEVKYTKKYNFNDNTPTIDSSLVSKGNDITGVICELLSEKEMVMTEFDENGYYLYNNLRKYESVTGKEKMCEVIDASQIAHHWSPDMIEENKHQKK